MNLRKLLRLTLFNAALKRYLFKKIAQLLSCINTVFQAF